MTREEAINHLKTVAKSAIDSGYDSAVVGAVDMAREALEQEPKWIPVSERLPEKYSYTLWCASSGCVRSDYFNGEFWEDAKKYCYEVIAWMPLPEPYRAESEGKNDN